MSNSEPEQIPAEIRAPHHEMRIPESWVVTNFTNVSVVTDYVANGSFAALKENVKYRREPAFAVLVRFTDFTNDWSGDYVYVDESAFSFLVKSVVEPGDVVIANVGDPGRVFRVPDLGRPMTLGPNSVLLRPYPGIEKGFICYFFASVWGQELIRRIITGTAQRKFNKTGLRSVSMPVAPAPEQGRIVSKIDELFSDIEEGERALERVQKLVERYRQSVLMAAVTGELTRKWREKHKTQMESGEALLARILKGRREAWEKSELDKMKAKGQRHTDDNWKSRYNEPVQPDTTGLPNLPGGWVWVSLPMLCATGTANGISIKGSDVPPGVPALRLDAMMESGFDYSARRYIPIDDQTANRLQIAAGDYFISRGNGSLRLVGRGVLAGDPREKIVFPDTMIRYRLVKDPDARDWLSKIWSSQLIRSQIERRAKTTAGIYKISQEDIAEVAIPLPSPGEQSVICSLISERTAQAQHILGELLECNVRARALRQAVLKSAFAGRLVPQVPSDEPASILLERIAAERSKHINGATSHARRKKKAII